MTCAPAGGDSPSTCAAFSVGGVVLAVRSEGYTWTYPAIHAYPQFVSHASPEVVLEVDCLRDESPVTGCVPVAEGSARNYWRLYARSDGFIVEDRALVPHPPASVTRYCSVDPLFRHGQILLPPDVLDSRQLFPLQFRLDFLLSANYLAHHGGALFHAAGVAGEGRGIVLSGPSGVGKSTLSELWRGGGGQVLHSDVVGLRGVDGGQVLVYGTPWWAGTSGACAPGGMPMAAICFLAHGPRNELQPLARGEAVSRLVSQCVSPIFYDADLVERLTSFCARVADTTPVYGLAFRPDDMVVDLLGTLLS